MLTDYLKKIKDFLIERQNKIILVIGVVLMIFLSFGLGILYNREISKEPITIEEPIISILNISSDNKKTVLPTEKQIDGLSQHKETGIFVASRKGKTFHLPSCSGAKQIKPENKIEFSSKAEAEAAGYKPAANCPGISITP